MFLSHKGVTLFVTTLIVLFLSGCSLLKMLEQSAMIENSGSISGSVVVGGIPQGAVIVMLYREEAGNPVLKNKVIANDKGEYRFYVAPGRFYLGAFVDLDNDGEYQHNERGRLYGAPDRVLVAGEESVKVGSITISDPEPSLFPDIKVSEDISAFMTNIGKVTSMDDPMFSRENYSKGLWLPLDFIKQVGGGLFFLEEYHPDKVPVLFVHGVNGGPTDLLPLIASLDRKKFQPWVLYYPSGFRLEMISDYLLQAVVSLEQKFHFKQFNVVAYSMGGLVTRSFAKKYRQQFSDVSQNLKFVMTVNSPMGGILGAAAGVKHSPFVVPAWNDLAPGSPFLEEINSWSWPKEIPYYLVFSYNGEATGDGVVSLESQIPLKLQMESVRMYGFHVGHIGLLSDSDFLRLFNRLMTESLIDAAL